MSENSRVILKFQANNACVSVSSDLPGLQNYISSQWVGADTRKYYILVHVHV